ncbi:hypothetical protein AAVH_19624 [Aphelenchoides avenae]|nr:hypothetical protein AAVH_19622 [Aphelenchus avenae]KAH7713015.1 hypothetical protein AAVH_19624 [Aphelenchus avenae]
MPLYYDWHFVGALVCIPVWVMCLARNDSFWHWLYWLFIETSCLISCYCSRDLLYPFYREWREPPDLQLDNAAPANGSAPHMQRGQLQHLPGLLGMLIDVFRCLPRAGLDACQRVSRQFRDAIEDAATTLAMYPMIVSLSPSMPLVEYTACVDNVGFVAGHFFTSLRRCDWPYFRNAAIDLRVESATYARTSTDMISAFVRWLNLDERNIRFMNLECEAYADELEDIFRFTDRHDIRSMHVIYKRSLLTPGCDFLSTLFAEARKRALSRLTVSLAGVQAKNCDIERKVGFQVLSEIFQDQERPSAERLTVIVPRLKGFRLLQRIEQAYERGEITRPLTIGCHSSVSMAELRPGSVFLFIVAAEHSPSRGPALHFNYIGETNLYKFSLPC